MIKERREDPDEMGAIALPTGDLLQSLIHNRKIDLTEADIQDKSKGDAFSKALVLFQILWFYFQAVSRVTPESFPLTELEAVTMLYVCISFSQAGHWWHKPQNVQVPMRIYLNEVSEAPAVHNSLGGEMEYSAKVAKPNEDIELLPLHSMHSDEMTEQRLKDHKPSWTSFFLDMSKGGSCDVLASQSYFTKCCISYNGDSKDFGPFGQVYDRNGGFFWLVNGFTFLCTQGTGCFLGFPFLSSVERIFWILSLVSVPLLVFFIYLTHRYSSGGSRTANALLRFLVLCIYPILRIYTLVRVFLLFRRSPPAVYCPIAWSWTDYFPHFF